MRSFLLILLLSLMTGCEAKSKVKGCLHGWVEFSCKYPKQNGKYQRIEVVHYKKNKKNIQSTQKDVWETKGRLSLYHDTENKKLKVAIKQFQPEDIGTYQFKFNNGKIAKTVELDLVQKDVCQGPLIQTVYRTAKTTITCDPGNKYESRVRFFCKETGSVCEDILSTESSPKSNGRFSLTETKSGFNISISDVSSHDAGVYWCGVTSNEDEGSHRASLRKIQLEVKVINKNFTRSLTIGQNFTYWCSYPENAPIKKFICKGEDPSICQPLVNTTQPNMNSGKFSMKDNKRNITITVRQITTEDAGTYWCGAESTNETYSNPFFHRFLMTVVPPSPTSPATSTQPTIAPTESDVGFQVVITVIVCVAMLLLLLFVLILILICKRFSHSNNSRNGAAAQHIKEDYVYQEIQERAQKPGNAVNTIYATVDSPTDPSASLHYSTINFQNRSDKDGGEALILKSRSACEYSTVKHSQSPTYSSVNHPSSPQDPLYSTVNKPQ